MTEIVDIKPAEIADIFRSTGAFLEGHFILSSGLHSPNYMQCAKVLQHPEHGERFARALAGKLRALKPTAILAPALGGILVGYELARALGVRSLFAVSPEHRNWRNSRLRGRPDIAAVSVRFHGGSAAVWVGI